jgi:hypothetical protein
MEISTDPALLSVQLPLSLTTSSSVITFMPDEESSTCPLLRSNTSPSPPLEFNHPLTPGGEENGKVNRGEFCVHTITLLQRVSSKSKKYLHFATDIDQNAETSSSDGSGIDIVAQNGTNGLFASHNNYQHLVKNGEMKLQVSSINIIFLQPYSKSSDFFSRHNVLESFL